MRIKRFVLAVAVATLGLVPFAGPAQATHNCGFEPCPHPEEIVELLCARFAILNKLGLCD
jgi:hypothetical protein